MKATTALLIGGLVVGVCAAETATNDSLRAFLQDYLGHHGARQDRTTRYSVASISPDGQTQMDLVYISGSRWCGSGGCTALLLKPDDSSFKIIQRFTLVQLPIRVLPTQTNGWHDIAVPVRGGGISGRIAVLRYNGTKYPGNPSIAPALKELPAGTIDLRLNPEGDALYP